MELIPEELAFAALIVVGVLLVLVWGGLLFRAKLNKQPVRVIDAVELLLFLIFPALMTWLILFGIAIFAHPFVF